MKTISSVVAYATAISITTAALMVSTTNGAFAQSKALLGSWKFDAARSRFEPGPSPYKSMTLNFSATDRGLKNDVAGVDAEGQPIEGSYMIVTDGKQYPVTGMSAFDSSSYTPVSDTTTVYLREKLGTTVVVGSRVLSKDGRTLTFRQKHVDRDGRDRSNALLVFERDSSTASVR